MTRTKSKGTLSSWATLEGADRGLLLATALVVAPLPHEAPASTERAEGDPSASTVATPEPAGADRFREAEEQMLWYLLVDRSQEILDLIRPHFWPGTWESDCLGDPILERLHDAGTAESAPEGSPAARAPAPANRPCGPDAEEWALGLLHSDRRRIQKRLAEEGFDPGRRDGVFDRATRTAIENWQTLHSFFSDSLPPWRPSLSGSVGSFASSQAGYLDSTDAKYLLALPEKSAQGPEVHKVLRDCEECPELVVVPAGEYWMGSRERFYVEERPEHRVRIDAPLAVGRYEVTFSQWEACHRAGGCTRRPDDEGWGRADRPVINVSRVDVQEYLRWLSEKTGKRYRLLSEAEWEYVARGGTDAVRYWGNDPADACRFANVMDRNLEDALSEWFSEAHEVHPCRDGHVYSSPAGSFSPNGFGLYDVLGNVMEWVEDCAHDDYIGAPQDARAWTRGANCEVREVRGGAWHHVPRFIRSASRDRIRFDTATHYIGFRVARAVD